MYLCNIKSSMKREIKIILSVEAHNFVHAQPLNVRDKIYFNIKKIETGFVSKELFKKLEGTDIWELRTEYESNAYRILAFWDKRKKSLVVATHGFVKKTMKTPPKEISKAEAIMKEYLKK